MPQPAATGRSLVTRSAIVDVIRAAALGSYGVAGPSVGWLGRLLARLRLGGPGIRVRLGPPLAVELDLVVAYGLPIAEVARQVDSAVRYALRRAVGRDVGSLAIHVEGLRVDPVSAPPVPAPSAHLAGIAAPQRPRRRRASGAVVVSAPGRDAA